MSELEKLLYAAEAQDRAGAGVDPVLLGAIADELEDAGNDADREAASRLRSASHEYDDVSYHGSPIYNCGYCGCSPPRLGDGGRDFSGTCPQGWMRVRAVHTKVRAELAELAAILSGERRAAYLKAKYGC